MTGREDLREWLRHPANVSPRELVAAALRRGWRIERQAGSHVTLSKPGFPVNLTIPLSTRANAMKKAIIRIMMEADDDDGVD